MGVARIWWWVWLCILVMITVHLFLQSVINTRHGLYSVDICICCVLQYFLAARSRDLHRAELL